MQKPHKLNSLGPDDFVFSISNSESGNSYQNSAPVKNVAGPVDYETAISATGFGKFNCLLLLASIPATWSSVFDVSSMSFVFPAAQCHLSLTLVNKGMLNAITFLGMISSAFLWGFLADTFGRQKLMMFGYFTDGIINVCCAFSHSFSLILLFKFLSGFVVCGPFATLMSFLSEFHSTKYRSRIILFTGLLFSTGNLALPCLGWWILPHDIKLHITETYILYSWQIMLLVCSLPMFFAASASSLLPESPKFLMSVGRNEEALEVFRKIYHCNTGEPKETFPIKELVEEFDPVKERGDGGDNATQEMYDNKNKLQSIMDGWNHIRPLFFPPYVSKILHVCVINMGVLLGTNTLRLWLPQFFKTMDEYVQNIGKEGSMCDMLEYSIKTQFNQTSVLDATAGSKCETEEINDSVYLNSIIVSITLIIGYILAGTFVNSCGKKHLIVPMLMISGATGFSIYWAVGSAWIVGLSSVTVALSGIGCMTLVSAIVEIFPTNLRTMAVSLNMMSGRTGSITGNLLFPILLMNGCLAPFLLVGGALILCAILVLALPPPAKVFK